MNYRRSKNKLNLSKYESYSDQDLIDEVNELLELNIDLDNLKDKYLSFIELVDEYKKKIKTLNNNMVEDFNRNARISVKSDNEIAIKILSFRNVKEIDIKFNDLNFYKNAQQITALIRELDHSSKEFFLETMNTEHELHSVQIKNFKIDYHNDLADNKNNFGVTWMGNIYEQVLNKDARLPVFQFHAGQLGYMVGNYDKISVQSSNMLSKYLKCFSIHTVKIPINFEEQASEKIIENEKVLRKIELIQRSRIKQHEKASNVGFIYVMSNKAYPGIYKIGSTYGLPEERAEELTGTGHLHPFKVEMSYEMKDAEYYEKSVHKILEKKRVNKNREFFDIDLLILKELLMKLSAEVNNSEKRIELSELKKFTNE